MSLTPQDLDNFHQFALGRIGPGGDETSFLELANQWQAAREREEVVALIREATADMQAGRGTPIADAAAEIRRELGFSGPQA